MRSACGAANVQLHTFNPANFGLRQSVDLSLQNCLFEKYRAKTKCPNRSGNNIVCKLVGTTGENGHFIVVGAHYDSVAHMPGADGDASGVSILVGSLRTTAAENIKH
eukprot:SAG11_NODE_835_length_6927_cov_2.877142_9_plen_107_part_00